MRVNADSLLIRAATPSTSGTLNDLTTDLIMANNNNNHSTFFHFTSNKLFILLQSNYSPEYRTRQHLVFFNVHWGMPHDP